MLAVLCDFGIMKKILLVPIILFIADVAVAQRFFISYEVVPYMYKDDVFYTAKEWKDLFEKQGAPRSYKIDSLLSYARHPNRPWNYGIQFRLQKVIPVYKESASRILEWNIGPGYHVLKNSPHYFVTENIYGDTTKPVEIEKESFD